MPFFLGAAGVLGLDASVGVQFLLYGEREAKVMVVVDDEGERGQRGRWRRVSGWMRGWVPSFREGGEGERRGLLEDGRDGNGRVETGVSYGALS